METTLYLLGIVLVMALGLGAALMPQGISIRTLRDESEPTDAELLEIEREND